MTDHAHLVRPQDDGSDTDVYLELARERFGHPGETDGPVFIGDCRLDSKQDSIGPDHEPADFGDPHIGDAAHLLREWPTAHSGFGRFVDVFWPMTDRTVTPDKRKVQRGSASGHDIIDGLLCAYVTVYDPYGCAEGLMHEWGHLRLRTLGVDMEAHDGTILDHADDEMYVSPIRKDIPRPMTACLHGLYAWLMLTELDLHLWEGHEEAIRPVLVWNLPKLEEGLLTFDEHARWADEGFGRAVMEWTAELVERGWDAVGREGRDAALAAHGEWVATQGVSESPLHDGRAA